MLVKLTPDPHWRLHEIWSSLERKNVGGPPIFDHFLSWNEHYVKIKTSFTSFPENYPSQTQVISSSVDDVIGLEFPPETIRILTQYSSKVRKFGLEILFESDDSNRITVIRVPKCFVERDLSEQKNHRASSLRTSVTNLIEEISSGLVETKGGFGLLPKTIGNILNSQACRGNGFHFIEKNTLRGIFLPNLF